MWGDAVVSSRRGRRGGSQARNRCGHTARPAKIDGVACSPPNSSSSSVLPGSSTAFFRAMSRRSPSSRPRRCACSSRAGGGRSQGGRGAAAQGGADAIPLHRASGHHARRHLCWWAYGGATIASRLALWLARVPALAPTRTCSASSSWSGASPTCRSSSANSCRRRSRCTTPSGLRALVAAPVAAVARLATPLVSLLSVSTNLCSGSSGWIHRGPGHHRGGDPRSAEAGGVSGDCRTGETRSSSRCSGSATAA